MRVLNCMATTFNRGLKKVIIYQAAILDDRNFNLV